MQGKFYRFWLVNEQGLYIFDQKLDKQMILAKLQEDELIANLYNESRINEDNTPILLQELPSYASTRLYFQKYNRDLYIYLTDDLTDITEVDRQFEPWRKIREEQRSNLRGIIFSVFDDARGPKVVYNPSVHEEVALLIAVQGATVSSMGKIHEFKIGFKEPLNVPNRDDLIHISYDFLAPAPSSEDPRIAITGRVTNLHLLFPRTFSHLNDKAFLQFLESYIGEWVYFWKEFQTENEGKYPMLLFDQLYENLKATVSVAIDLATHEEREIRKLKDFVMDLLSQNQVLQYQVRRLKDRIKELEEQK
jgi:hypothetical protein